MCYCQQLKPEIPIYLHVSQCLCCSQVLQVKLCICSAVDNTICQNSACMSQCCLHNTFLPAWKSAFSMVTQIFFRSQTNFSMSSQRSLCYSEQTQSSSPSPTKYLCSAGKKVEPLLFYFIQLLTSRKSCKLIQQVEPFVVLRTVWVSASDFKTASLEALLLMQHALCACIPF